MDFLDFKSLTRPASPNTYLLAPEGVCPKCAADASAPIFQESARDLFVIVSRLVRDEPVFKHIDEERDEFRIRFVAVTPILRFKDDIDIQILTANAEDSPKAPGSTLAIYSRSRVGYSDLGANEKRVGTLMKKLSVATQAA